MARLRLAAALVFGLAACDDMSRQERMEAYETPFPRQLPGTVARGELDPPALPPVSSDALLARGRERYAIYCQPCHGDAGAGDGIVARRTMPAPPSFLEPRLRQIAEAEIVRVITEGKGVMYSFAARVRPDDRWAIAAHIKALQQQEARP